MKTSLLTTVLVIFSLGLSAKVGVNTDGSSPDGSAMLGINNETAPQKWDFNSSIKNK